MYGKSAQIYDALYEEIKDYGAEARRLSAILKRTHPHARTLLEVACGTGRYLEHLQKRYRVAGVDLDRTMLRTARARVPDVPLRTGDMRDLDLQRRFDVVCCLFGSVAYTRNALGLRRAIVAMARHVEDGGILAVEPFFSPQKFWRNRPTLNVVDRPDLKIAWSYVSKVKGRQAHLDYHFTIARPSGVEHYVERHVLGLFSDDDYRAAFAAAGLTAQFDPFGLNGRGLYVASARTLPKFAVRSGQHSSRVRASRKRSRGIS